jgi:hypothetical protein
MSNFDALKGLNGQTDISSYPPVKPKNKYRAGIINAYVFGLIFALLIYQSLPEALGRLIGLTFLWEFPIVGFVFGGVLIGKEAETGSQVLGVGLILYSVLMLTARKHGAIPPLFVKREQL